jgi:signal transduction histidine kinase
MRARWPAQVPVLVGAGVLYALFGASISHWFTRSTGLSRWTMQPAGPAIEFVNLFGVNLALWCGWGLLALLIFHLGRRVRFERVHWVRTLVFHAVASMLVATAHIAFVTSVRVLLQTIWGLRPEWWASFHEAFFRTIDTELPVYWALLGFQHAIDYYRESRERAVAAAHLETRLIEAQLQALQRQLHPHFLFNTLHAISALVHRDPDRADEMIERLSDLLRVTLHKVGVQEVRLAEELEYLRTYLAIQQVHFGDRLRVGWSIDAGALDALVPNLLLQPLVENAVTHGLAPRREGGTLAIEAECRGSRLLVRVGDDGVGMTAGALDAVNQGVGLTNTRARLARLYGDEARLAFDSRPGRGVVVTIELPFRPAAPTSTALEVREMEVA